MLSGDLDTLREGIDRVFSREVLGAVLVGAAAKQVVDHSLELLVHGTRGSLAAWSVVLVGSVALFAWWEHVEATADEAAESAAETAETATEKASEATETAAEKASEATKTAAEATQKAKEAAESATGN